MTQQAAAVKKAIRRQARKVLKRCGLAVNLANVMAICKGIKIQGRR